MAVEPSCSFRYKQQLAKLDITITPTTLQCNPDEGIHDACKLRMVPGSRA